MATSAAGSLPDTSVDNGRLSVALSTPASGNDEPGRGSAFNPASLAAGRLVHCHATKDNFFLCAFANTLTAATMSTSVPGAVTAFTFQGKPSFWWVSPDAGKATAATDRGSPPSLLYAKQDGFTLNAGASNGGMVYYLGTFNGTPILLSYRTDKGVVDFVTSSWLPPTIPLETLTSTPMEAVVWNRGITCQGSFLYLVGARASDGALYLRKIDLQRKASFYLSESGWSSGARFARPIKRGDGTLLKSLGMVSVAMVADEWYLSTTAKPSANVIASFWRARHPLAGWESLPQTVDLGTSVAASSSGVFFQPAVSANAAHPSIAALDYLSGLPYTFTVESSSALRTAWGLLPVPRRRL